MLLKPLHSNTLTLLVSTNSTENKENKESILSTKEYRLNIKDHMKSTNLAKVSEIESSPLTEPKLSLISLTIEISAHLELILKT